MAFILVIIILVFVFEYRKIIDTNKFVKDLRPYTRMLMEDDYKFLVTVKYGVDADAEVLYDKRIQAMFFTIVLMLFIFISNFTFINILLSFIVGIVIFKLDYIKLTKYYKNNLYNIDRTLPYYLKSLEILIQHYTVPVALRKSIATAPEIFKPGLERMVARIEEGDSSVDPYMDFAKEYPVRDSMRMMRLLYRLGLGSNENKQEQLLMFSKTVSSLQNKSREQRYKDRLEKMESKTMRMLFVTGGLSIMILFAAMIMMLNV